MAKKTEQFDFDDDSFWKELDEGSGSLGGFADNSQKGGRRKAVTEFAGSFLSGVKKTLLDPSNQRKFLADNMPDGYVATFDAASTGVQGIKDIYRSTKDEIDKNWADMSKDAATLNKHYGKVLPKRIQDKLNRKLENAGGGTYRAPTEEENLNDDLNGIMSELADVQRTAALANQQTTESTTNRIVASQNVNTAAVSVSNRILSNISGNSEKIVGINFTNGKLARKQIELTFKSFVVQRQMLDTLQQTKDLQQKAFRTLIQNTGLPEAVKITNWELAGKSLKQKMVGMATERMTATFAPTAGLIFDRVKENFTNKASMAGGSLGLVMSMLAMQADMGGMGGSRAGTAGDIAGQGAGNLLQWYMRKKLGDKFKDDPRFKRYGDSAMNFMDSFPGMFNKLQNNFGSFSTIMHALGVGDILAPDSSLKTRVRGSAHKHFDEVVSFNKKSELALTEVIPGWLGKVHHQLKIMATGDQNAEEERYDYEKAGFITRSELTERTKGQMYQKNSLNDSRAKANRIVNALDKKNELSKKDRQVLMRYVLQQANSDTGFIDPAALMDTVDSPLNKYDPKAAARIASVLSNENNFNHQVGDYDGMSDKSILFGNLNSDANYQATMRNSNDLLKELRRTMPNSKNVAVREANVGNIDILRELGAVKWDPHNKEWKFDNEELFNNILNGRGPSSPNRPNGPRPGGGSPYTPPGFGGGSPGPSNPSSGGGSPFSGGGGLDNGPGGYSAFQQELLETIERTSARASMDIGNQILESIRQRLEMGVPQGGEAAPVQQQDRKANWFRRMMAGSMQATGKGLKSYFKFATVKAPTAIFRTFVQAPMRVARGVMDLPSRVFGKSTTKIIDSTSSKFGSVLGDLYVRGKENAVIKLADLKAGNYYDATTKKVIKSFKDIKGAIVDKESNVVITEEEVKAGLYTVVKGKTYSIIGGALRAGMSVMSGIVKANFAGLSMVTGIGRTALNGAKSLFGFIGGTPDVYVQGESTPRLLSRIMRAGGYFNKDGSLIKSVNDIRGDVVDAAGDVILGTADIAKGLVDKRGRPFKTLGDRLRNVLLAPARLVGKTVKGMYKLTTMPFRMLGKAGKSVMSFFTSKKDSSPEQVLQAGALDTLNKIYGLLDERLVRPKGSWMDRDGSGFRDGSREDVLSRRNNNPTTEDKGKGDDDDKKDRKGILGLLMGIAGGIGGLIGTVKGWAKNIFALMRLATQTKLAGSAMDMLGGLMGGRGGRGRGGRLSALFRGAKNFITRTKVGKVLAAGAIVAGTIGVSKSAFGADAVRGAANAINGAGGDAEKEAMSAADFGAAPSSSGGSVTDNTGGSQGPSFMQRVLTGAGGGMMGELAAIAAFPAVAALYQKAQGTKLGSKVLPQFQQDTKKAPPTTKMGKVAEFLMKTKKGRLITAGLLGGGIVGGQHMLTGTGGEDLGEVTQSSMASTLMLDLAAATALPLAAMKGKQLWDARKAARAAQNTPRYNPINPTAGGGVFRPGVNPTFGRAPMVGPQMPTGIAPTAGASGIPAHLATNAVAPAASRGIGSRLMGAGKGIFRNAGILGTGYAAYDALTTEGSLWDKTKAFGTSLATSAAIGKGMSLGGKLFSTVGRQALMQGARTGAVALASALGTPVVLGGLAVAALGYGAWKGYKYFFGTDKNAIARFRMAQYGFNLDDKEKATIIGQFEQLCQKNAVVDNAGKGYFKKNISATEIFKLFGIQENDKERINAFIAWFNGRFKPVFLRAFAFYKGKTKQTTLEKADSLPKKDKLEMLNTMGGVTGNPSPYSIMVSPFPDGKKLKFDEADVKSELKVALRNVGNEKGPGEKTFTEKTKSFLSDRWENVKDGVKKAGSILQTAGELAGAVTKNAANYMVDQAKNTFDLGKNVATGNWAGAWGNIKQYGSNAAKAVGNTVYDASAVVKMSGTQKEWQLRVYKAFKAAGFSEQHARILTAEIGRENSYNPKYLFGGHADPHSGSNLGMLSWQGPRKTKLKGFLQQAGVVDQRGNIIPGQKALDAQAQFIMWELKNTHKKVGAKFLASPNISYKDGAYLIGKHYILWRIDDPKYAAGKKNRDGFYNMLLKQLGAKDGDAKSSVTTNAGASSGTASPLANNAIPSKGAGAAKPATTGGGGGGFSMGGGGWFGYMMGGSGGIKASETSGGGFGGGTDLVAAAKTGAVVVSGKASDFIKSIDPKLIALGQKHTRVADKGVDLAGMVKGFMVIFYAMIGEAVTRGVLPSGVMVNSANRSIQKQKELYDAYIRDPKRNPMAAKPGNSRHNYGIAIDINSGHANTLASANLLGKYGFTRPLLNHPRKPEAWHLESDYFKRGSGDTVTEVAKATKDSGDKSKVDKATKDQAKANPIVKAEAQTKPLPPTIAKPKSAEEQLKSLSSGFMGGSSTWGGLDKSTSTPITAPTTPTSQFLGKSTSSMTSTTSAVATQKQQRADIESTSQAMLNVQTQQLQVQQEMVGVLHEIRDTLKANGVAGATKTSTEEITPPASTSANRAAELIRAKSRDIPVSMSINR